ncbi:hypothetical protein BJV82DRAFT_516979 [Fennellomyces sp. T-0311]|nr:hypothetical protein BJV82DRAFT_516979 [Fennellomyces sp. T-0311]
MMWPRCRHFKIVQNEEDQLLLQEQDLDSDTLLQKYNIDIQADTELANSNLPDVFAIIESDSAYYFLASYRGTTLQDLITYNPGVLSSNLKKSFVVYQILRALASLHSRGIVHGSLKASNILVDENLWTQLAGMECSMDLDDIGKCRYGIEEEPLVMRWVRGDISNFTYLMALNHLAGRREGDPNFHPIMPWITDFSGSRIEDGWRDFTKTKFRMNKGEEQLDFTFNGPVPHHITDILSDITYYVYLARRTPIPVLCQFVRSKYEPNEYPSSMQRLYNWTPDECIPEFYTDPSIFTSMHSDMPDLQIPQWANSPEDFIAKHAAALESDYVSQNLHHWIDLTFGNNLTGKGAVEAKNVALPLLAGQNSFMKHGIIQLFKEKHPQRGCNWNKAKEQTNETAEQPQQTSLSSEQQSVYPDRQSSYSTPSLPSQRSLKSGRQGSGPHTSISESPSSNTFPFKERASSVHSACSSIDTSASLTSRSTATEQPSLTTPVAGLTSALRNEPIRLPTELPDEYFTENLIHYEEAIEFSANYKFVSSAEDLPTNPVYDHNNMHYNIEPFDMKPAAASEFSIGTAYDMFSVTEVIQTLTAEDWQNRPSAKSILCASFPATSVRDPFHSFPFPECIPDTYEYLAAFYQAEWTRRLYLADKWIDRICELENELLNRLTTDQQTLRPNIPKVLFDQKTINEFVKRLGTAVFLQQMLPCYLESLAINSESKSLVEKDDRSVSDPSGGSTVSEMAGDALTHICTVLGPILTSKHIVRQLVKIVFRENIVRPVHLHTIGQIANSFGETFTAIQYAYLISLVDQHFQRTTNERNAKIICSAMSLLEELMPHMSGQSLATELKSGFVLTLYKLLEPLPSEDAKAVTEQSIRLRLTLSMRTIDHLIQSAHRLPQKEWETTVSIDGLCWDIDSYLNGY